MAKNLVVPSDITVCEEKCSIGSRKLSWLESFGLMGMAPMLHIHYSKLDRGDMRKVLSKKYDPDDASAAAEICKVRQAAVSRTAVSHNFLWLGGWAFAAPCYWSFRRYDWKARALAIPFLFYAGTFAGRVVGDIVTGKNSEFARDTFLGSLPAKVYYTAPKDD